MSRPGAAAAALVFLVCAVAFGLRVGSAGATFPGRNGKIVVVRSTTHRQIYIGSRSGDMRLLSQGFGLAVDSNLAWQPR